MNAIIKRLDCFIFLCINKFATDARFAGKFCDWLLI